MPMKFAEIRNTELDEMYNDYSARYTVSLSNSDF